MQLQNKCFKSATAPTNEQTNKQTNNRMNEQQDKSAIVGAKQWIVIYVTPE